MPPIRLQVLQVANLGKNILSCVCSFLACLSGQTSQGKAQFQQQQLISMALLATNLKADGSILLLLLRTCGRQMRSHPGLYTTMTPSGTKHTSSKPHAELYASTHIASSIDLKTEKLDRTRKALQTVIGHVSNVFMEDYFFLFRLIPLLKIK